MSNTIQPYQRKIGRWPILIIILLAAMLRMANLGAKSLWYDEAMLRWIALGNPATIITQNAQLNSAPPLFPMLIGLIDTWARQEFTIRFLPALASIVSVAIIYRLTYRVSAPATAAVVALLAAVAPSQVLYAQQLREYAMTVALGAALLLVNLCFVENASRRHALYIGILTVVALLTQYGLALLVLAVNITMLLAWLWPGRTVSGPMLRRWLAAQLGAGVVAVLVVLSSLRFQFEAGGFGAGTYLGNAYWDGTASGMWRLLGPHTVDLLDFAFPWPFVIGTLLVLGIGYAWRIGHIEPRILVAVLGVTVVVLWIAALARLYPYHGDRQLLFLTPLLYVTVGLGIEQIGRWIVAWRPRLADLAVAALVIVLAGTGLARSITLLGAEGSENTRPVIAALEAARQPNDAVYIYYAALPAYDFYTPYYAYGKPEQRASFVFATNVRNDFDAHIADIEAGLAHGKRLWLLFTHCYLEECDRVIDYAANLPGYTLTQEAAAANTTLYLLTPE